MPLHIVLKIFMTFQLLDNVTQATYYVLKMLSLINIVGSTGDIFSGVCTS